MTDQLIAIPNPPSSKEDAIACFTALGTAIKLTMETVEANPDWVNGATRLLAQAHKDLNRGGYVLEELFGQPEGTFGAGGTSKGGGGGGGG